MAQVSGHFDVSVFIEEGDQINIARLFLMNVNERVDDWTDGKVGTIGKQLIVLVQSFNESLRFFLDKNFFFLFNWLNVVDILHQNTDFILVQFVLQVLHFHLALPNLLGNQYPLLVDDHWVSNHSPLVVVRSTKGH